VLVELGVVEQRHKAVLEVLDGARITDGSPDGSRSRCVRSGGQGMGSRLQKDARTADRFARAGGN